MKTYKTRSSELLQGHITWISEKIEPTVENKPPWMREGDPSCKASYRLNNFGLRCDDFVKLSKNEEHILFAGCERTLPMDEEEQNGWANILYKEISKNKNSFKNLSYPGASVEKIVANLFKYFKEFGNPESIYFLAPELIRDIGFWKEHLIFKPKIYNQYNYIRNTEEHNIMCVPNDLPMQLLAIRYLHAVRSLQQYCEVAGVNLYWTSWDPQTNEFLSEYDNYGFFNINEDLWTQDSILNAFRTEMHRRVNGTV